MRTMFSLLRRLPARNGLVLPSRVPVRTAVELSARGIASTPIRADPTVSTATKTAKPKATKILTTKTAKAKVKTVSKRSTSKAAATRKATSKATSKKVGTAKKTLKKKKAIPKRPKKKAAAKKSTAKKITILPGTAPPKRPQTAWSIFASDYIKTKYNKIGGSTAVLGSFMKEASGEWTNLSASEKESYQQRSMAARAAYVIERQNWVKTVDKNSLREYNRRRLSRAAKAGRRLPMKVRARGVKDDSYIKKPMTSFFQFLAELRKDNPGSVNTVITKQAGEQWRKMSAAEKLPYQHLAEAHKKEYEAAVAIKKAEEEVHSSHSH